MAKNTKPAKEEVKETKSDEPKFGVEALAEATGLQPASVRVALRDLGVEKSFGNKYGWNTQKDFDAVVKQLKERSANRAIPAAGEKKADTKADAKTTKGGKKDDTKAAGKGGKKK